MNLGEFLTRIRKDLVAEQGEIGRSLARGSVSSFESYRELVGEVKGIERALNVIDDSVKKLNEEDIE